jgi:hypothetical protein
MMEIGKNTPTLRHLSLNVAIDPPLSGLRQAFAATLARCFFAVFGTPE